MEIIKRYDNCIDVQVVNMGGSSKSERPLQLVDMRGVVKHRMDGKIYLVILIKDLFNPNAYKTLLEEEQI